MMRKSRRCTAFSGNRRVSLETLVEPHVVATHARCAALGEVLVIHDTTDMVFAGEITRTGLTPLGKGRQGFWLHTALALSADGLRAPLGVLSLRPFVRPVHPRGTVKHAHVRFQDPDKESGCNGHWVAAVRTRFGDPAHHHPRHGSSWRQLRALRGDAAARRSVRGAAQRRSSACAPMTAPPICTRWRRVARCSASVRCRSPPRRSADRSPKARHQHPPRAGRVATLQFAAQPLTLLRPHPRWHARRPCRLARPRGIRLGGGPPAR